VNVAPVQAPVPQLVDVGAFSQAPRPSQRPFQPQGGLAAQPPCGSMSPAGTGWQEPAVPTTLQDRQLPQLAASQQTPSTQLSLSHSEPAPQIWPRRFFPHAPSRQRLSPEQSA